MDSIMQIDGYYYDPAKKRHFRTTGRNKYHPLLQSQSSTGNDSSIFTSNLNRNVCKELTRLHTNRSCLNVPECLLHGRFTELAVVKSFQLELYDPRGVAMKNCDCDYLLGDPENDSLYGVWSSCDNNGTVIKRVGVSEYESEKELKCLLINGFAHGTKVEDLCVVKLTNSTCSALMCLTSRCHKSFSVRCSLNIHFSKNDLGDLRQAEDCNINYEFIEPVFSCSAHTLQNFAIGCFNLIRLFTPFDSLGTGNPDKHDSLRLQGKVTALKFSQDGKRLYAGTNKGHLVSFDVNSANKDLIDDFNLKTKTITYLYPLKNDNQIVVSCHDSKLFLMDNRNSRSPVISFPHHVNDCKKIPVSVDESVNVLCSSGQDYKVRLWSLRSGKLLHEISPPTGQLKSPIVESSTMRHSWYSQSWKSQKGEPIPIIFTSMRNQIQVHRQKNGHLTI